MSRHTGQKSSKPDTHSEELQLAVLTQRNQHLVHEFLPFKVAQYQHQDELNLLLKKAKQLKYHCFAVEQQPLLCLPDKASQVSKITSLSFLIEIYETELTKGSILYICGPLTNSYVSLIYDTLYNPFSDTLFEFCNGVWTELQSDRVCAFWKSLFEFLKRLTAKQH